MNMNGLISCMDRIINEKTAQNLIVKVGIGDNVLCETMLSANDSVLTDETMFDMASVTKIVATTSLALIAMDRGLLSPDDKVSRFFPVPHDKAELTVRHLMTHTIGFGHKSLLPSNGIYSEIQDFILRIPSDIPIGSNVRYSCPGFILLGRILEKIFEKALDQIFLSHVAKPLEMCSTCFLPPIDRSFVNSNLPDNELGTVNDYNARYLGGICGNAGLFSNLCDMTKYVKMLLSRGAPLFSADIFKMATKNYTAGMKESRALGFVYVDEHYMQTGGLFPVGSIGHLGHTGQSVFADPLSGLYVIVLSDATISTVKKYGVKKYDEVIHMRHDLHAAIKSDLERDSCFKL